jgi:hypothetical protein
VRRRLLLALVGLGVLLVVLNLAAFAASRSEHGRLPGGVGRDVRSHVDPALTAAVTVLSGRQAVVHCWSPRD